MYVVFCECMYMCIHAYARTRIYTHSACILKVCDVSTYTDTSIHTYVRAHSLLYVHEANACRAFVCRWITVPSSKPRSLMPATLRRPRAFCLRRCNDDILKIVNAVLEWAAWLGASDAIVARHFVPEPPPAAQGEPTLACPASATSSTNGLGAFSDPYSQGLGDLLHHQASGLVEGVFCVCPAMPEQAKARSLPHTICTWACCTPKMEGRHMFRSSCEKGYGHTHTHTHAHTSTQCACMVS